MFYFVCFLVVEILVASFLKNGFPIQNSCFLKSRYTIMFFRKSRYIKHMLWTCLFEKAVTSNICFLRKTTKPFHQKYVIVFEKCVAQFPKEKVVTSKIDFLEKPLHQSICFSEKAVISKMCFRKSDYIKNIPGHATDYVSGICFGTPRAFDFRAEVVPSGAVHHIRINRPSCV